MMKKLTLILFVLLFSYSGSYAYVQISPIQGITVNGSSTTTSMMTVNINNTCPFIRLEANWSPTSGGIGTVQAYSDILIGEYFYNEGTNDPNYSSLYNSSRYWNSITVYLAGNGASGTATLRWGW